MKNNQRFSIERKNTHDPKWACGLFAVFPVENVTQAPSPSSPFHSSMSLLLQFSHRLSCVVVVYLVLATIYGRLLYGVGGRFPIWVGRGVVPGSTGVPRVACPWVRCRAPPGCFCPLILAFLGAWTQRIRILTRQRTDSRYFGTSLSVHTSQN